MLILTRRVGEKLMIGDDLSISVLRVNGNQVSLGVTAPEDVSIHREEVYEQISQGQGKTKTVSTDKQGMEEK